MAFAKLKDKSFLLKIGTLVLGGLVIILMTSVYDTADIVAQEVPFLIILCLAFVLSLLFVAGVAAKRIPDSVVLKRVEISYHFLVALLIFMTASIYLFSVMMRSCSGACASIMTRRYLSALFGYGNGALYGLVAWNLLEVKIVSAN